MVCYVGVMVTSVTARLPGPVSNCNYTQLHPESFHSWIDIRTGLPDQTTWCHHKSPPLQYKLNYTMAYFDYTIMLHDCSVVTNSVMFRASLKWNKQP